jgi:hypothetical protein
MWGSRPTRPTGGVIETAAAVELRGLASEGALDERTVEAVLAAAGHGEPAGETAASTSGPGSAIARSRFFTSRRAVSRTKAIASELYISPKTADHHIQHVYTKIGSRRERPRRCGDGTRARQLNGDWEPSVASLDLPVGRPVRIAEPGASRRSDGLVGGDPPLAGGTTDQVVGSKITDRMYTVRHRLVLANCGMFAFWRLPRSPRVRHPPRRERRPRWFRSRSRPWCAGASEVLDPMRI